MRTIFFLIPLLICASISFAYPISPRPLRKLVIESQYIVWGKVIETGQAKTSKKNEDSWNRDYARIVITEVLQGNMQQDTIQVFFCSGMICPAPGVFYDDETVLAFLDRREKAPGYTVHALSYGVKHGLTRQDYQAYKERILEMQQMITKKEANVCGPAMINWLMKCAEQQSTRWEGLYEIRPESDFMSYYNQDEMACKDSYITTTHRKKLFEVLMAVDTLSYPDMALVDIAAGINDSMMLAFLKTQAALANGEDGYYWMPKEICSRIALLVKNKELDDLIQQLDKVYYNYDDSSRAAAKLIYIQLIEKIKTCELKKPAVTSGDNNVLWRQKPPKPTCVAVQYLVQDV